MSTLLEIDGERFEVRGTRRADGTHQYDFGWLNGPAEGTYGFTVGGGELTRAALEGAARGFVRSFFEPGGIGPSDFADFVEARRREPR